MKKIKYNITLNLFHKFKPYKSVFSKMIVTESLAA